VTGKREVTIRDGTLLWVSKEYQCAKGVPARAGLASRGQDRADYGTTALEALVMHMNIIAEIMMTGEHNSTIENARQRFKGR